MEVTTRLYRTDKTIAYEFREQGTQRERGTDTVTKIKTEKTFNIAKITEEK